MFRTAVVVVDDARIAHTRDGARNEGANNRETKRAKERERQGEKLGLIKKEKEVERRAYILALSKKRFFNDSHEKLIINSHSYLPYDLH